MFYNHEQPLTRPKVQCIDGTARPLSTIAVVMAINTTNVFDKFIESMETAPTAQTHFI